MILRWAETTPNTLRTQTAMKSFAAAMQFLSKMTSRELKD
jgi:hypothetical protein